MVGKKGDSMLQYQVKHYKGSRECLAMNFVARYIITLFFIIAFSFIINSVSRVYNTHTLSINHLHRIKKKDVDTCYENNVFIRIV